MVGRDFIPWRCRCKELGRNAVGLAPRNHSCALSVVREPDTVISMPQWMSVALDNVLPPLTSVNCTRG
jgi:hypothetical protein